MQRSSALILVIKSNKMLLEFDEKELINKYVSKKIRVDNRKYNV